MTVWSTAMQGSTMKIRRMCSPGSSTVTAAVSFATPSSMLRAQA
jgi:hypothetical protein